MIRRIARSTLPVAALVLAACGTGSDTCWTTDTPEQLANRPSPLDSTMVTLGEDPVKVCYGRPSARERTVMDGLVRYGDIWRFGANEATSIHIPFDAAIGDVTVAPGSYSLYVIPGPEAWNVHVNGIVERWGIPVDDAVRTADIGNFTVPTEETEERVETLTLTLESSSPGIAELVAEWERTRIRIPIRRAGA